MKIIARITLLIIGVLLLAYYLPKYYWMLTDKKRHAPITFYSCVRKDFLFYRYSDDTLQMVDQAGENYSRSAFEELLPLNNYLQLYKDGRLPESIDGVKLAPRDIDRARLNFRIKPVMLDNPVVRLNPLLEAESGRVKLEMPNDFMRLGQTVEFIDSKTNAINREKSEKFARALSAAGFVFPPKTVGGNPTTLKPYDDGYFIADATGATFHLRQVRGEPEIHRLAEVSPDKALWQALKPVYLHVQEQDAAEIRAIAIGQDGQAWLVVGKEYRLVPVPFQRYDPHSMSLTVRGDLLNRLITVTGEDYTESVVLNRKYEFVARYTEPLPTRAGSKAGQIAKVIFPVTLYFDDDTSGYLGVFAVWGSRLALVLNAVLALVWATWIFARKQFRPFHAFEIGLVLFAGIYGLIAVLAAPKWEDEQSRKAAASRAEISTPDQLASSLATGRG
jgi:hypothetical protein